MMLVKAELPERYVKAPKYTPYIGVVREFAESGEECMEAVRGDGDEPIKVLPARLRAAIVHAGLNDKAGVSVREGHVYLVRRDV